MELVVFTDGGALNNPGPAASAYVISQGKTVLHQNGVYLGPQTNNFAEYQAVILALEKIKSLSDVSRVDFYSDSKLLVSQLNGLYKIKNAVIRECVLKIRGLEQEIGIPISYTHVYREENVLADSLVKQALQGY